MPTLPPSCRIRLNSPFRGLPSCIAFATSSFPVPVSPVSRTVVLHGRDLLHSPQDCTERRALTDDALSAALLVELLLKVGILHLEAVAVALQLAEELCALDGHRRLIGENPQ